MDNVINISDYRSKDDDLVSIYDEHGNKCYVFLCSFKDDQGNKVGFDIIAKDMQDAESKLEALKKTAIIDGQLG